MAKPMTPKKIITMGYANIVIGAVFIILNLFERIYFLFEVYLNLLLIVMGFVLIIVGISRVAKGKSYIKSGLSPNTPIPKGGLIDAQIGLTKCPSCQKELGKEMDFCPFCGWALK